MLCLYWHFRGLYNRYRYIYSLHTCYWIEHCCGNRKFNSQVFKRVFVIILLFVLLLESQSLPYSIVFSSHCHFSLWYAIILMGWFSTLSYHSFLWFPLTYHIRIKAWTTALPLHEWKLGMQHCHLSILHSTRSFMFSFWFRVDPIIRSKQLLFLEHKYVLWLEGNFKFMVLN